MPCWPGTTISCCQGHTKITLRINKQDLKINLHIVLLGNLACKHHTLADLIRKWMNWNYISCLQSWVILQVGKWAGMGRWGNTLARGRAIPKWDSCHRDSELEVLNIQTRQPGAASPSDPNTSDPGFLPCCFQRKQWVKLLCSHHASLASE